MKMIATLFAAIAAFALPATAQNGVEWYGNAGVTFASADDLNLTAATLRGGANFTENFGAEVEASFGIDGDDLGNSNVEVELDTSFGVFGVARVDVHPNVEVFGRLGYVTTEASVNANNSFDLDDDGFAYGVGANWWVAGNHGVRADYTRSEFGSADSDAFTVSYAYKFSS